MSIKLHNSNIVDEEKVSFVFIVEQFTDLTEKTLSKTFYYGGHRWRLQGGVEDGFLGLFLRWVGGGKFNEKLKCTAAVQFSAVNRKDPLLSVSQGNLQEEDEFPKFGAGVGWSRLVSEKQLLGTDGFIDKDNTLLVELKIKMGSTVFMDDISVNITAKNHNTSSEFSLCGSNWRLALFPRGDIDVKKSAPQQDHVSLYLNRLEPTLLRYKVKFLFLMEGARQVPIVYHFQSHTDGCASGIEKVMRTRDLKAHAKKGTMKVGVKIISIEPYFFFAMDTKQWEIPKKLDPSYSFNDQCNQPFMLKVISSENNDLDFQLVYDPDGENEEIDDSFYYVKLCWSVMVFSFKDENKSVKLRSADVPGKSCFCYSKDEMTLSTLIHLEQVARKNGIYVDDDQLLSVRLVIEYSNEHYDPLMEEGADKNNIAHLREASNQQIMSLQKKWQKEMDEAIAEKDLIIAEQAEELVKKELIIDQQESALHELDSGYQDALDEYYEDLADGLIDEEDSKPDNDKAKGGKMNEKITAGINTAVSNQENEMWAEDNQEGTINDPAEMKNRKSDNITCDSKEDNNNIFTSNKQIVDEVYAPQYDQQSHDISYSGGQEPNTFEFVDGTKQDHVCKQPVESQYPYLNYDQEQFVVDNKSGQNSSLPEDPHDSNQFGPQDYSQGFEENDPSLNAMNGQEVGNNNSEEDEIETYQPDKQFDDKYSRTDEWDNGALECDQKAAGSFEDNDVFISPQIQGQEDEKEERSWETFLQSVNFDENEVDLRSGKNNQLDNKPYVVYPPGKFLVDRGYNDTEERDPHLAYKQSVYTKQTEPKDNKKHTDDVYVIYPPGENFIDKYESPQTEKESDNQLRKRNDNRNMNEPCKDVVGKHDGEVYKNESDQKADKYNDPCQDNQRQVGDESGDAGDPKEKKLKRKGKSKDKGSVKAESKLSHKDKRLNWSRSKGGDFVYVHRVQPKVEDRDNEFARDEDIENIKVPDTDEKQGRKSSKEEKEKGKPSSREGDFDRQSENEDKRRDHFPSEKKHSRRSSSDPEKRKGRGEEYDGVPKNEEDVRRGHAPSEKKHSRRSSSDPEGRKLSRDRGEDFDGVPKDEEDISRGHIPSKKKHSRRSSSDPEGKKPSRGRGEDFDGVPRDEEDIPRDHIPSEKKHSRRSSSDPEGKTPSRGRGEDYDGVPKDEEDIPRGHTPSEKKYSRRSSSDPEGRKLSRDRGEDYDGVPKDEEDIPRGHTPSKKKHSRRSSSDPEGKKPSRDRGEDYDGVPKGEEHISRGHTPSEKKHSMRSSRDPEEKKFSKGRDDGVDNRKRSQSEDNLSKPNYITESNGMYSTEEKPKKKNNLQKDGQEREDRTDDSLPTDQLENPEAFESAFGPSGAQSSKSGTNAQSPQKGSGERSNSPQKTACDTPGSPQKRFTPSPAPRARPRKHTSIQRLIREAKPDLEEVKELKSLAETLGTFLGNKKELPFNVDCVTVVGAVGQGTCLKGKRELDLAILIRDLPTKAHSSWLPAVAYSIRTVIKTSLSSQNTPSKQSRVKLPPCSNFNSCRDGDATVMFKCGDVDVVLIPTNSIKNPEDFHILYDLAIKEGADALPFFVNTVCRRQTEFIYKQTDKCKELIDVVKQWRDSVAWKDEESRPSSYLLSLLVVLAYQVVCGGGEYKMHMEKGILTEFAEIANDPNLDCYWENYYQISKYPRNTYPKPFTYPIVQDPALPHHNVAETGLKDWTQFRQEIGKWVDTLAD